MNAPLRRVAIAALVLFGLLFLNLNYLQVVEAGDLRQHASNRRLLVESYSRERGQIVAGGVALADSVETKGRLKFLRRYPGGAPFAPVTGFFPVSGGATGVEKAADGVLSGEDSRLFVRRVSDIITGRTPQGGIVTLTIKPALQQAAYRLLAGKRGAVVALDPQTGAVLAMVSVPSYDPNPLVSHDLRKANKAYDDYLDRDDDPLLNRAAMQTYAPGSTFKVIVTAAALESGRYRPDTPVPAPRVYDVPLTTSDIGNFGDSSCGGATIPLARALQISCNTSYAALGNALGGGAMRAMAERFGFETEPELELPTVKSHVPDDLNKPQEAQAGIGQYDVRATPLQMALVAAAVANGGNVIRPYVVAKTEGPNLALLDETAPRVEGRAISAATASALDAMMAAVVTGGTGRRAAVPGLRVAGKTGTAQRGAPGSHAWFIGYGSRAGQRPSIAVAVIVEGGSAGTDATGGRVAAPIAGQLIAAHFGGAQ